MYVFLNILSQCLHGDIVLIIVERIFNFFGNKLQAHQHIIYENRKRNHKKADRDDIGNGQSKNVENDKFLDKR